MPENELLEVRDRAAWRRWLERHHTSTTGVRLVIYKRGATAGTLSYEEAVLEGLCFGWIDSTTNGLDEQRYTIWMASRKPRSGWSESNKRRVEVLVAEGLMAAAGLAAIETAKANGSWNALDKGEALEVPDDLVEAFDKHPGSRANWEGFPPGVRKQILQWIYGAKRPPTRQKRVETTASLAARNERAQ